MIEARALSKRFSSKLAVDDLSFDVRPGVVTGFLGPNGAGKSTTMRLMLDLDHGDGRTTFDGRAYRELPDPLREVGTLLEAKPFHPGRSARNHLRMLAASNGLPATRADEVLELVGLHEVAKKKPKGFSLGMGQRLGLAGALLGDPKVLILDEPANGLDPQGINWLRGFLKAFASQGRAVFVSSHLLAEMSMMADHLVVIGRGRLLADAPVSDFIARARSHVVVRSPRPDLLAPALQQAGMEVAQAQDGSLTVAGEGVTLAAVGQRAFDAGVPLHELSQQTATLEEAFLEVTAGSEEFRATGSEAVA